MGVGGGGSTCSHHLYVEKWLPNNIGGSLTMAVIPLTGGEYPALPAVCDIKSGSLWGQLF